MVAQLSQSYAPLAYAYSSRFGSGRISVPVPPSQVIYSSFEHVTGVAAADSSGGISIDSLKILDILIDRLSSIKRQPLAQIEAPASMSPARVDALIEQYSSELHTMATASLGPYGPKAAAESGILFSVAA